ncbi:MAG: hypothetical protein ACR2PR_05180 [Pseudohongiellaceae bacterium]
MISPAAQAALERVTDFALLDADGRFHQLSRYQHRQALVLMAFDPGCDAMAAALAEFTLIRNGFAEREIDFVLINSVSGNDSAVNGRESATHSAANFATAEDSNKPTTGSAADLPVLQDNSELVSAALGLSQAGEVLVLNPQRLAVYYRGPADEALGEVLEDVLGDEMRDTLSLPVSGCPLPYPSRQQLLNEPPDYATDVAPLLINNCVDCHRQGGVGPFPMDNHLMVLGWSHMIREVVLNKRMPPMQVDPQLGHSVDARYLSAREMQLLVRWIEAGAPRGEAATDPLQALSEARNLRQPSEQSDQPLEQPSNQPSEQSEEPSEQPSNQPEAAAMNTENTEWLLGEPDYVVTAPPIPVAATGIMDYIYAEAELNFNEDKWIRAVQYLPGDESVLHHLLTFVTAPEEDFWGVERQQGSEPRRFVAGFSPGPSKPVEFPSGTGVFIPAGYKLSMQFHYVTNGQSTVDETRLGLYFSNPAQQPNLTEHLTIPLSSDFVLPPHAPDYALGASHIFTEDVVITGVRAHMSFRGKRMRFAVEQADGTREAFFSIPAYNYGWQPHYRLSQPVAIPAGTRVWIEGAFDNSISNPNNPAPESEVRFGVESWEEMFTGYLTYHRRLQP